MAKNERNNVPQRSLQNFNPDEAKGTGGSIFLFFLVFVLVKLEGFRYSLEDSHGCHRFSGSGGIVFLCHH